MPTPGTFIAELLTRTPRAYASGVLRRQAERQPGAAQHVGTEGFLDLERDTEARIQHLAQALAVDRPGLFLGHVEWVTIAYTARELPLSILQVNLECLRDELREQVPEEAWPSIEPLLDAAAEVLANPPALPGSLLEAPAPHIDLARRYMLALLEGRGADGLRLLEDALDAGVSSADLRRYVVGKAQAEFGRMWQFGEIHVGEEHHGSRVAERALALLAARTPRAPRLDKRVLLTAVGGDYHDIGLRVISDTFEAAGWDIVYLGASTPDVDILRTVLDFTPDLLAISCNHPLHVRAVADVIAALRAVPIGATLPVLVGGLPFNDVPDLWEAVNADASAQTPEDAVEVAARLVHASR